jgi:hypothetical protein
LTGPLPSALGDAGLKPLVSLHGTSAADKTCCILKVRPHETTGVTTQKAGTAAELTRCCSQLAQILCRTCSAAAGASTCACAPQCTGSTARALTERSAAKNPAGCGPARRIAELSQSGLLETNGTRKGDQES